MTRFRGKINSLVIIMLAFLLFLVSGFFIRQYLKNEQRHNPEMSIVVKYKDVPPVIQDFLRNKIRVFYRGFPVGEVSKVSLSCDHTCIDFYLDFYYKGLKLPKNIMISLDSEDLYGSRHFALSYPKSPSQELLKDGDVVYGTRYRNRIDKYLYDEMESGRLSRIIANLEIITGTLAGLAGSANAKTGILASDIQKTNREAQLFLKNMREIMDDPQVKRDIKSTIKSSSKTLQNINKIMSDKQMQELISTAPQTINKTVNNLDSVNKNLSKTNLILPEVNETVYSTNNIVCGTNAIVSGTNSKLTCANCNLDEINRKVPEIPPDLLPNADKAVKKANCLMDELSYMLSKRFLGLRLIFGNPGKPLKKCPQQGTCGSAAIP